MSDKERELIEKVAKLPEPLRVKFLDQARGAVLAMDALGYKTEKGEDDESEGNE